MTSNHPKRFDYSIDLTGERCPDTFVYTRIKIDELLEEGNKGNVLRAIYDSVESWNNVFQTLTGEGLSVEKTTEKINSKDVWVLYITLSFPLPGNK
ncbi:hypothetical protein COT30_02655 [Candidatus Micrarchaeota archaeon CG08_land_8_20_14_0_20_49_17]|nr:MAG: hypothetical protein AUJ13_05575 [Candidatus Micrarchaeota archaeon CG1_02_49_24]PIU09783.1 MAG: hypothetical protein COT30_02655 [Candidatus Micrarchaeota archaeon CG08_land_8_20_14_0_20_49_17]PIU81565.1 MAG: hypothetical protein COS70_03420 [Candidatus Micrarchaeota archaeon CG06_land_8_20_14_3_00_50_6]PIZ93650.1 MAG: hypothetical protein COX84_05835 [Candidatus Micrarchaeota archaeon CG_4_10_14_0_2_um_filter_49_7]HII54044.1 hypothetical protein [Candidatus Micrarchaeota archaeon]